ncbi:MAG TPA: YceI family protein [Vicinamibacteria bacterium]|jgi:polyisoprenoid-binding protein YceI
MSVPAFAYRPLLLAGALVAAAPAGPSAWKVTVGDVRVVCPLTVGGAFETKSQSLGGQLTFGGGRPAAVGGSLAVDLRTLDTGIDLRNQHLREKYLEVARGPAFEKAVLTGIALAAVDPAAARNRTTFTGTLSLHGVSRPVSGSVELRREGAAVRVEAAFPVSLSDYGVEKPYYLGVGVGNELRVKVVFLANPASPTPAP